VRGWEGGSIENNHRKRICNGCNSRDTRQEMAFWHRFDFSGIYVDLQVFQKRIIFIDSCAASIKKCVSYLYKPLPGLRDFHLHAITN